MEQKPYRIFAKIYDKVYRDDQEFDFYDGYMKFIDNAVATYNLQVTSALEVACGTGNLGKMLLDRGWQVDGIDQSEQMLAIAQQKGINTFHSDFRNFSTGNKYDLALCIFDSLNYAQSAKDMTNIFRTVAKHLERGGVFLFDLNSDYKIARIPSPDFKMEYGEYGDDHYVWLNSGDKDTWIADLIYFEKQESGLYKLHREHHVEKGHAMEEIMNSIAQAGLEFIEVYSNFDLEPLKTDSWRWFFVTKKKQ